LGSGSTAALFIAALGRALAEGSLADIRGIPTSRASADLAAAADIPLTDFEHVDRCRLTIDGADEIGPELALVKGLGGALLREKIVAQNSDELVIIADAGKVVDKLGTKSPLPVEVTPFGQHATRRFLESLGCRPELRDAGGKPFVTDNANLIYDCHFAGGIADPAALARQLEERAGVVQHGLFLNIAAAALIAGDEVRTIKALTR
jgi:ribose 5-phosphate isomerase A